MPKFACSQTSLTKFKDAHRPATAALTAGAAALTLRFLNNGTQESSFPLSKI